jgi:hypothetical protein
VYLKFLTFFQYSLSYFKFYSVCFSFSLIFSFLAILQVLKCASLLFHVFECLSLYSMSNSVCVSFSKFFSFHAIFQVLHCLCLIFHIFQFSRHISGPTVSISHFSFFSCFSTYSRSYQVSFSFSYSHIFLAIFHVLQCLCLIFHIFQFSRHIPGPIVCISNFPRFSVFLSIFQVKSVCVLIFQVFQISTFFSVSCHIPGPTVFLSAQSRSYSVYFSFFTFFTVS